MAPLSPSPPLDRAPQLIGQLDADGTASLEAGNSYSASSPPKPSRSLKAALDAVTDAGRRDSDATSETASEEDYDALKHDPMAVVNGAKGGGFPECRDGVKVTNEGTYEKLNTRPSPKRRLQSIPVTLNKLKEHGRYILRADDDALKELLRAGIEREKNPASLRRRSKFSDLVFTRRFTAFDRQNADSADSTFHGFLPCFWLGTALYMMKIAAENWRHHGNILGTNEIMGIMFHKDLVVLGLSDGVMCAATGFGLGLQSLIFKGVLSWNKQGWIIQSVSWTHTVFFVLHGLVMLMKQHSYAFYNGHLSEEYKTRATLHCKLKLLESIAPVETPSASTPQVSALSTSYLDHRPTASDLNQRRQYQRSTSYEDGASNVGHVAAALESGQPLDIDQIHTFERIIKWEIDALTADLMGKCTTSGNSYPLNLNVANHYEYIVLPTLVYELEYPRSDKINWYYVGEKAIAVLGILGIMQMVAQSFIYPVVVRTIDMKDAGWTLQQRLGVFPWILSDLIFPFMMEYMMTWYIIWECILNLLAELTFFADRGFYADWWNSVSWGV